MTGTFLISPYIMVYDLAWLAFPIAWLALAGQRSGWLRGERQILVAAWLLPLLMASVATSLHLRLGPWVLGALLWTAIRRAKLLEESRKVPFWAGVSAINPQIAVQSTDFCA